MLEINAFYRYNWMVQWGPPNLIFPICKHFSLLKTSSAIGNIHHDFRVPRNPGPGADRTYRTPVATLLFRNEKIIKLIMIIVIYHHIPKRVTLVR